MRYVYDKGYATRGMTDWTFEIDDQGRPFYVITNYKKRIGFKGADALGVIVLDVQTGDIKPYTINDAPKWIDRLGADGVLQTTKGTADRLFATPSDIAPMVRMSMIS